METKKKYIKHSHQASYNSDTGNVFHFDKYIFQKPGVVLYISLGYILSKLVFRSYNNNKKTVL